MPCRPLRLAVCALALLAAQPLAAEGVAVGKPSMLRNLVPAERLEQAAAQEYREMKR